MLPVLLMLAPAPAALDLSAPGLAKTGVAADYGGTSQGNYFSNWFIRSDAAKESQPHWMTPAITVTPRLEQEYRYDQFIQLRPKGVTSDSYGGGKGIEVIPTEQTEIILGIPAWQTRTTAKGVQVSGWADESFLLKYRFIAANEENGNYIFTAFLGASVPTGSDAFTNHYAVYTPTLAGGKGWGTRELGFDIQSTLGMSFPAGSVKTLGKPVVWNTAFQGHVGLFWPAIETTYTYFEDGPNNGKDTFAIAGEVILGRFNLGPRARLIFGGAYQWTVTSFQTINHQWVITGRVAF